MGSSGSPNCHVRGTLRDDSKAVLKNTRVFGLPLREASPMRQRKKMAVQLLRFSSRPTNSPCPACLHQCQCCMTSHFAFSRCDTLVSSSQVKQFLKIQGSSLTTQALESFSGRASKTAAAVMIENVLALFWDVAR